MHQGARVELIEPPAAVVVMAAKLARDEAEFALLTLPMEIAVLQGTSEGLWHRVLSARCQQIGEAGMAEAKKLATYAEVCCLFATHSLNGPLCRQDYLLYAYCFVAADAGTAGSDFGAELAREVGRMPEYELQRLTRLRESIRRHQWQVQRKLNASSKG